MKYLRMVLSDEQGGPGRTVETVVGESEGDLRLAIDAAGHLMLREHLGPVEYARQVHGIEMPPQVAARYKKDS